MSFEKKSWSSGNVVKKPYVVVDGVEHEVQPATVEGGDPITIDELNRIENGIEEASQNVYSTEERVIGKWIDGKPLYRKVIDVLVGVATEFVASQVGVAMLEKGFVYVSAGSDKYHFPLNFSRPDREVYVSLKNNTATATTNFEDWKTARAILILNYTKTTD